MSDIDKWRSVGVMPRGRITTRSLDIEVSAQKLDENLMKPVDTAPRSVNDELKSFHSIQESPHYSDRAKAIAQKAIDNLRK